MAYNRAAAIEYAKFYAYRVCHDGKFATRGVYPTQVNGIKLEPGLPFSKIGGSIPNEVDCTHFISCCIGSHWPTYDSLAKPLLPLLPGGGLHISSTIGGGVYGLDNTPALVEELKKKHGVKVVGNEFQQKPPTTPTPVPLFQSTDTAIRNLEPGDLLAYASAPAQSSYEHICLILEKGGKISCHSNARFGEPYTDVKTYHWVTLLKMP